MQRRKWREGGEGENEVVVEMERKMERNLEGIVEEKNKRLKRIRNRIGD